MNEEIFRFNGSQYKFFSSYKDLGPLFRFNNMRKEGYLPLSVEETVRLIIDTSKRNTKIKRKLAEIIGEKEGSQTPIITRSMILYDAQENLTKITSNPESFNLIGPATPGIGFEAEQVLGLNSAIFSSIKGAQIGSYEEISRKYDEINDIELLNRLSKDPILTTLLIERRGEDKKTLLDELREFFLTSKIHSFDEKEFMKTYFPDFKTFDPLKNNINCFGSHLILSGQQLYGTYYHDYDADLRWLKEDRDYTPNFEGYTIIGRKLK